MTEQAADTGSNNTDTSGNAAVSDAGNPAPETTPVDEGGAAPVDNGDTGAGDQSQPSVDTVPESYTFSDESGYEADGELIKALTPALKEAGLTQAQAEKLFSAYSEHLDTQVGSQEDEITNAVTEWENQLRNDDEFGGEQFDQNVGMVRDFIEATVPAEVKDELFQAFRDTGFGSHPALIRYLHSMAKKFPVSEDQMARGNGGNNQTKKSAEQRLYGTD